MKAGKGLIKWVLSSDYSGIGHFRVRLSLHFKASLSAKSFFVMKISFHSY